VDEAVRHWQRVAFGEEDKPMLEAQQIAMRGRIDLMSMRPILLSCDAGAVQIRRTLQARLEAEVANPEQTLPRLAEAS
jgi:vanillate O-demethylase monooxygenase subunit